MFVYIVVKNKNTQNLDTYFNNQSDNYPFRIDLKRNIYIYERYTETTDYKDMQSFFDICKEPYWKRIAMALYYTGCRAGEVIQITNEDINREEDSFLIVRIHTEKNPHAPIRYIPIDLQKEKC